MDKLYAVFEMISNVMRENKFIAFLYALIYICLLMGCAASHDLQNSDVSIVEYFENQENIISRDADLHKRYSCIAMNVEAKKTTIDSYWEIKNAQDSLSKKQYPEFMAKEVCGSFKIISHFVENDVFVLIIEDSSTLTNVNQVISLMDWNEPQSGEQFIDGHYYYLHLIPFFALNTAPNFDKNNDIIVEDRLIFMSQLGNNIYLSNNIKNGLYVKEESKQQSQ